MAVCACALSACGGGDSDSDTAADEPSLPTTHDGQLDPSGGPWRVIEVPAVNNAPSIVHTPDGWFALSSRVQGDPRAASVWKTALYRSGDGVEWDRVALHSDDDTLELNSIAYGNGRYVMMGRNHFDGVVWVSNDATHWTEGVQSQDRTQQLSQVVFVGGEFIAFAFRVIGFSEDGTTWKSATTDLVQMMGVAHGNSRFVMTGSGPVIISDDGVDWRSQPIDCSLPETCITDPSGGVSQAVLFPVVFAEHRFFAGRLASSDGIDWSVASEQEPSAYVDGHFFSLAGPTLSSWTLGKPAKTVATVRPSKAAATAAGRASTSIGVLDFDAPLPKHVSVAFEDGLTCATSPCILIDGRLFLVPPPGTPKLRDRTPRDADGEPLLSDECPVSRMIFCTDYEARTDCACNQTAPAAPSACTDVSRFECEGAFVHQQDEWTIDEVAEGGCSCGASDPNQPATFGLPCNPPSGGRSAPPPVCKAPLECLAVQSPPSFGPPEPQPFVCTAPCTTDADCPSWQATGFCAGEVKLQCVGESCQPRTCNK